MRELLGLALEVEEVHEDGDLGAQDDRVEGLVQIVDGPDVIAAPRVDGVPVGRRQEDDRDVARALTRLDHAGGLVAVHAGHADVEQDGGEVVAEHLPQRVLARARADQVLAQRFEDRPEQQEVLRPVVDQEDVRWRPLPVPHHAPGIGPSRALL